MYYRKRGSASYIVRQWLLWEGERERERDACDVIDITLKSRVIMHMITSTARRPNASTRSEPVERSNFEVHERSLALERSIEQQGRVIDERPWGSGSFAFAGQTAVDHPTAFRWHASSKKNRPSWCLFPFRMAMVLPLRTAWIADILSQASLRDVERQRCWKRGSGDFGTTLRHDLAIFSSMPLTGEVRRSPEPSARPSAAADSEERQICTTCLFAESVGLCLCFLPSCAMYKNNAVGNVVAEMGRDLVFMITARLSDLSMPLKGEVRRSPVQSARQPIARSGKLVRRAYSRRALDCEKYDGLTCTVCMLSHVCFLPSWSWSTLLYERGLGEERRFDVASRSQTPKTSCQNHKQQLLRPRSGRNEVQ